MGKERVVAVAEVSKEHQLVGDNDLYFFPINAFSVTMEGKHELKDEIILAFRYNAADLNPNYPAEEQIIAYSWDERRGFWSPISCTVDTTQRLVRIRTKHLSFFSAAISGVGLAKAAAAVGAVAAATYIGHAAYEKVWLDVYNTANFRIIYSKADVNAATSKVNDTRWWPAGKSVNVYTAKHPRYVQDLGRFLEEALVRYQTAGFTPPPTPIEVKINSALIGYKGNPAGYEHWHGRIHVNTALAFGTDRLKQVTAHELFHAVQSADRGVAKWWEESTAEYASCMVAWSLPSLMGGGSTFDIYPKLLSLPMTHVGVVASGLGEIEYDKGYFVSYLMSRGGSFAGAWRVVAASSGETNGELRPLDTYLRANGTSLGAAYRNFAGYFLFAPSSPIGATDPAVDSADARVALPAPSAASPPAAPVVKEFIIPAALTTRLLAVSAPLATGQQTRRIVVGLLATSSDTSADVYLLRSNAKAVDSARPVATLEKPGDSATVEMKATDMCYVAITNTHLTDEGMARITLSDFSIQLAISPSAIKDVQGKLDHSFTATAKSIPASVRKIEYRWSFGDTSQPVTGTGTPTQGSVSFTGVHTYPRAGRYAVSVEILDSSSGAAKALARASAHVEILDLAQINPIAATGVAGQVTTIRTSGKGLFGKLSYVWNLGDGSKAVKTATLTVDHLYPSAGRYTVSVKAFDASSKLVAQATGIVTISQPAVPAVGGKQQTQQTRHLSSVRPTGSDSTTVLCDLVGSTQYFVTKKMLNYPDPPFEIGLHDKGTSTIDSVHKDFGPAEYKLYKVIPPKTYMDYLMDKSVGITLVETLSVN